MTSFVKTDMKGLTPPVQLARGKDFARSWKLFMDQMAQFGKNGQEIFDGIPRRPQIPEKYTSIQPDGT